MTDRVAINIGEQDADGEWEIDVERRVDVRGGMVGFLIDEAIEWFRVKDVISESFPDGFENPGSIVISLRMAEQRGFA